MSPLPQPSPAGGGREKRNIRQLVTCRHLMPCNQLSAFTCTGRSACRSARIATSTAMCVMRRSTNSGSRAHSSAKSKPPRAYTGPRGLFDLSRRRHAIPDAAADGRRDPQRHRPALAYGERLEVTLEANPTSVEATTLSWLSRSRRSIGCRSACRRWTIHRSKALGRLHTAREALDAVAIARSAFDPLFVRSDLRAARPDAEDVGRRVEARDLGSRRTSVAVSAHHRTGDAVPSACMPRASSRCPTRMSRAHFMM